jgi:hypothetical protein
VVDAICALPHPVPTNAIAAPLCMTHLLTGSDDGYIRDYDIFTACNGKNFLSAPQRQHCGFVEGVIKAGVLRSWWKSSLPTAAEQADVSSKESVHSLLSHSDSLWGLSGSEVNPLTSICAPISLNICSERHHQPLYNTPRPWQNCTHIYGTQGPGGKYGNVSRRRKLFQRWLGRRDNS